LFNVVIAQNINQEEDEERKQELDKHPNFDVGILEIYDDLNGLV
jgi:hypothetical protein